MSGIAFGGIPFGEVGERAALPRTQGTPAVAETTPEPARPEGLRLVRYRPLFSGPAVERTPELNFQRPGPEVELSEQDAHTRDIRPGDDVTVRSNGTSVTLRARLNRDLRAGVVRIADQHAGDLQPTVELAK